MVEKKKPQRRSGPGRRPAGSSRASGSRAGGQRRKPQGQKQFAKHRGRVFKKSEMVAKAPSGDKVRVIVLGGCEEVGRNCTLIEYKNDIVIIDMGLEFPEEHMPGVDYIIPNMSYLKGKEKNIRGVIITHGHYDHIGAIPHTIPEIGNPPVYGLPITAGIIKKRQQDFHTKKLDLRVTKVSDVLQLGVFKVSFFHINHNIPDSVGIVVESPAGVICHTGDWKFDFHPAGTEHADFQGIAEIGKKGVLCLMGDSTNAIVPGHQTSEKVIGEELESIIEKAPGRVIIGTFASLLARVKQILEISEKHGKKVVLEGYSMKTNVEIAKELGFIKVSPRTFIKPEQANKLPDNEVVVVCTGAQGEKNAALNRIANGEHRAFKIQPDDTIVFSSSVIPGNEAAVQRLMDAMYRKRANVINYKMMDVHAGGHAKKEDIKLMLALLKPKYYVPIEGNHFLLRENGKVAESMGWDPKNVFICDNGQVMEFWKDGGQLTKEKVPTDYVFVDGLGVGDVSEVVLRDRRALADDGMVVAVVKVDRKTGKLIGSPDIVSRGFIFMKEHKGLIEATRKKIKDVLKDHDPKSAPDRDYIRNTVRDEVGQFLFQKTERRPMVLPVVLEV